MVAAICPACGYLNTELYDYCPNCGVQLQGISSTNHPHKDISDEEIPNNVINTMDSKDYAESETAFYFADSVDEASLLVELNQELTDAKNEAEEISESDLIQDNPFKVSSVKPVVSDQINSSPIIVRNAIDAEVTSDSSVDEETTVFNDNSDTLSDTLIEALDSSTVGEPVVPDLVVPENSADSMTIEQSNTSEISEDSADSNEAIAEVLEINEKSVLEENSEVESTMSVVTNPDVNEEQQQATPAQFSSAKSAITLAKEQAVIEQVLADLTDLLALLKIEQAQSDMAKAQSEVPKLALVPPIQSSETESSRDESIDTTPKSSSKVEELVEDYLVPESEENQAATDGEKNQQEIADDLEELEEDEWIEAAVAETKGVHLSLVNNLWLNVMLMFVIVAGIFALQYFIWSQLTTEMFGLMQQFGYLDIGWMFTVSNSILMLIFIALMVPALIALVSGIRDLIKLVKFYF